MLKKLILFSVAIWSFYPLHAQELRPRGYFSKDTVKLGEVVDYTLTISYPRKMEVLFPDSNYQFSPFEYLNKKYYGTVSDLTTSYDSVVYQLATFELDSLQVLSLPVFLVTNGDSTAINAPGDSVILQFLISEEVDSLTVKETAQFQNVNKAFNYPYLFIGLAILLLLALLVLIFFGKQIRRKFLLYRMRRAHEKFMTVFGELQSQGLATSEQAERLLGLWKKYLEKLENLPYTKLTTKEIVTIEENLEFRETLRSMDSIIYGQFNGQTVMELISKLKGFGIDRYQQKIQELKHA